MILRSTLASPQRVSLDFSDFWSTHPPALCNWHVLPKQYLHSILFHVLPQHFLPILVDSKLFERDDIKHFQHGRMPCELYFNKCSEIQVIYVEELLPKKGDVMNDIAKTNTPEHSWFSPGQIRTKIAKTNIMAVKNKWRSRKTQGLCSCKAIGPNRRILPKIHQVAVLVL